MRNLSYREAAASLALIAAASLAAYRLWFVPALAQLERDRETLEQLVSSTQRRATPTAAASPAPVVCVAPLAARPEPPKPPARPRPQPIKDRGMSAKHLPLDIACADDRDPLCGALDQ
jgi:hypothetical protein